MNKKSLAQIVVGLSFFILTILLAYFNLQRLLNLPQLKVIGFLPYWNLAQGYEVDFKTVDQLIYFSLTVNEEGDFDRTDGGWNYFYSDRLDELMRQARENKKKVLLCITSFDAKVMYLVTSDPEIRQKLVENIAAAVKVKNFDGVDIDFEYFASPDQTPDFGQNFNLFLSELKAELQKISPDLILSVDIYPKAIITNYPYELNQMVELSDQIIIMAYDFTQSNSDEAGPIAPLNPEPAEPDMPRENYSIPQTLEAALKIDKSEKWILGVPLYGYQWQTRDKSYRSAAINWGLAETVQYGQVKKLIEEKKPELNWSVTAQSPWLTWEENRRIYQLYYEDPRSLQIKFDLANQKNLAGIALWSLGYEEE